MGPGEVIAAVALFVGLPWATFSGLAKIRGIGVTKDEKPGLRASELEAIVRGAVEDAVEPMRRRLETLEAIATDDEPTYSTPGRLDPAVLADALGTDEVEAETAATRRRARD